MKTIKLNEQLIREQLNVFLRLQPRLCAHRAYGFKAAARFTLIKGAKQ